MPSEMTSCPSARFSAIRRSTSANRYGGSSAIRRAPVNAGGVPRMLPPVMIDEWSRPHPQPFSQGDRGVSLPFPWERVGVRVAHHSSLDIFAAKHVVGGAGHEDVA